MVLFGALDLMIVCVYSFFRVLSVFILLRVYESLALRRF